MVVNDSIQISQIKRFHYQALADFFAVINVPEITRFFHPHRFTPEDALRVAYYAGPDFYAALLVNGVIKAYGILRGWEAGYETPSLGLCVDPSATRQGYGKNMMDQLHRIAKSKGARSVMLKVYEENVAAIKLYSHLGYQQIGWRDGQIVYIKDLGRI